MPFKYDKLWLLLEEQRMTRSELREKIGISQSTIVNMGKNENVSLTVIDKICKELKCHPFDFLEYIPDMDNEGLEIKYKRGDIYYADLRDVGNSEQGGVRPVVIVQNDVGNKFSPTVIIAPLTSQLMRTALPTHVMLKQNETGLAKDSLIITENIRVIDKRRLREKIASLNQHYLDKLDFALKVALNLK